MTKNKAPEKHNGIIALVILAFGFGIIAITVRYMSSYFTLFQQLYLSLLIAFLISLFIFKTTFNLEKLKNIPQKDWFIMILRVIVGYLIAASIYRESLVLTKISNVTFIQSIPFGAVFGWILFKEHFTFKKLIYILIAYFGVVLIAVKDLSSLSSFGLGEFLSLISSALFSLSYLSRKWMSNYLNDKEITQILLFTGTVILFAASLINGDPAPKFSFAPLLILSIFFTGFFNAVNIFLINYGFRKVKAVLASNILTLESVFALILAFIFYRELPSLKELFGGFLILGSVIQMNRLGDK